MPLEEDITWLGEAFDTLREKCIDGITVNSEHNAATVKNSIGIVTALNPYTGNIGESAIFTKEQLDKILSPEHMLDSEEKVK